ncbi:MAG: cupredoxin domain-containing protein [Candidatus Limnocylindria bacterium]
MNRYAHLLLAFVLTGALAACAPAADEPSAPPSNSLDPTTSPSAPPLPSHDMGDMGDTGDMGGSGERATVEIANFAFAQPDLTVSAGTEVTFTNLDPAPHTVTAGTDAEPMTDLFDSGLLEQGESFTFVFDEPGTYVYFCDRHPPMEGMVTVES